MRDHEEPEMVRTPVEELCLTVKSLKLPGKIEDTLGKALMPPKQLSVKNAIDLLVGLGALVVNDSAHSESNTHNILASIINSSDGANDPETLTPLGWKLSLLPVHPCLGKMLLFGSWLEKAMQESGNLDLQKHLLSLCATLSFKSPFVLPMGKEREADAAKKNFGWDSGGA
jgi:ATP-dependent RNA helicase DHX36